MGSLLSACRLDLEEEDKKKKVPSGSSNGAGDGQAAATPGVPTTSGGSGTEKKQSESSSSSSPPSAGSGTEKKQSESSSSSSPQTATTSEWVPYKFSEIVGTSAEQLRAQVYKGIYLDGKKKKYWVDKSTKANCFMLFARGLSITWGSDTRYWSWRKIKPDEMSEAYTQEADMEVACLKDVCWLEIRGSLDMSHLSPGYTYDVVFVAKLAPGAYGWSVPVELQLKVPSGSGTPPHQQSKKENIWRMDGKEGWRELKVGEVEVPAPAPDGQQGNVDVAMLRLGGDWKRGLILLGIKINSPRSNNKQ